MCHNRSPPQSISSLAVDLETLAVLWKINSLLKCFVSCTSESEE